MYVQDAPAAHSGGRRDSDGADPRTRDAKSRVGRRFQQPVGGSYTTYSAGSSIGAWTVTGDSVDLIGTYWAAPTIGGGSVDLDGNNPGGVQQTLNLTAGTAYDLTFYLSGNPDGGSPKKAVNVSIGDFSHKYTFITGDNNHDNMNYKLETVWFVADANNTLSFTSLDKNGSPWVPVVGGVSVAVAAVPELSTWAMMIAGFACLGFAGYRRNRPATLVA